MARYRARYPERIAAQAREHKNKNSEYIKEKKKRYYLKYPEKKRAKLARRRIAYKARYPDKVKLSKTKTHIRKMFVGVVVDAAIREMFVETKLLQLNIKKLLKHGETNEKRS
jgi:hypothetical protein